MTLSFQEAMLRLYLVTDPEQGGSRGVPATVRLALAGGATCIQLRDKDGTTDALVQKARELGKLCRECGVPLIINDRVDVALSSDADGVHVGTSDMPVKEARHLLGPRAILGASVRTPSDIARAERDGATYVAANGVFSTATKTDFGEPLRLAGLRTLVDCSPLPVVAIGGISAQNAADVIATGCAGLAVVSAVMKASDPELACRELLDVWEAHQTRNVPSDRTPV